MGAELILANLWISSDYFLHFLTQAPFLFPHTDPSGGLVPASTHKVLVLLQRPHVGNGGPSKTAIPPWKRRLLKQLSTRGN